MNSEEHDANYWRDQTGPDWIRDYYYHEGNGSPKKLVPICAKCGSDLSFGTEHYSCDIQECSQFLLIQRCPPFREAWELTPHDCRFLRSLSIVPE